MKIIKTASFIFLVSLVAFGCSKKEVVSNVSGLGMEADDNDMVTQVITTPDVIEPQLPTQLQGAPQVVEIQPAEPAPLEVKTEVIPLPPEGEERNRQIQTALKNANLYFGEIDGKIGPLTRKAIEEFQSMKGLKVDGKVGPITWGELQKYLNVPPVAVEKTGPEAKKEKI